MVRRGEVRAEKAPAARLETALTVRPNVNPLPFAPAARMVRRGHKTTRGGSPQFRISAAGSAVHSTAPCSVRPIVVIGTHPVPRGKTAHVKSTAGDGFDVATVRGDQCADTVVRECASAIHFGSSANASPGWPVPIHLQCWRVEDSGLFFRRLESLRSAVPLHRSCAGFSTGCPQVGAHAETRWRSAVIWGRYQGSGSAIGASIEDGRQARIELNANATAVALI